MIDIPKTEKWCENVIIVDGDYIDKVAFDLIVNFERIIGRHIPQADMAQWIDYAALDGGLTHPNQLPPDSKQQTSVVFIHDKRNWRLENFTPGNYQDDLHMMAFKDQLGEFLLSAFPVEEDVVSKRDFFIDVTKALCHVEDVKRITLVPDEELLHGDLQTALKETDDGKRVTVLIMQPTQGGNFQQEVLGFSLMAALGIRSDELR